MAVLSQLAFSFDSLRCPRDNDTLRPILFGKGKLHHCGRCAGSFLPGEVVRQVPRIERWFAIQKGNVSGLERGTVDCPIGHGAMLELRLEKHQLDLCATCHGIWFDADELKRLQKPRKDHLSNDWSGAEEVMDAGDIVADGAGDLVGGALELLGEIVGGISF